MKLTVYLERLKDGRVHRTRLTREVRLHIEIVEEVYQRLVGRGVMIDIDELIDQRVG